MKEERRERLKASRSYQLMQKVALYMDQYYLDGFAGLVPGDNLILSFEKHGKISIKQIDAIIEYEVVPRL